MMTDWGRVVNMYYTFSILTFLYLFKKNYLKLNQLYKQNFFVKLFKTKNYYIYFYYLLFWMESENKHSWRCRFKTRLSNSKKSTQNNLF